MAYPSVTRNGLLVHDTELGKGIRIGTRSAVIDMARDSWDSGDRWGSAMGTWFAISWVLAAVDDGAIPEEWKFRSGGAGYGDEARDFIEKEEDYLATEFLAMFDDGETSTADLVYAGNVMQRYAHACERKGIDY